MRVAEVQDMNERGVSTSQRKFIYSLLFLIWPFGSSLAAIKFNREPLAKNIFWLFCIFFGYTFVIDFQEADSARYVQRFTEYAQSNSTIRDVIGDLYSKNTWQIDIVQPLLTYLVSRMTRNPSFLFAAFAFIFGFFYSRNLWYLLDRIRGRKSYIIYVFLVVFALLNPIWNINGFRMYTAVHIFLFGALPYLLEGKKKYLIWAIASVFVHFSLFVAVMLLIGFSFLPRKSVLFFWFFIITSFIKEIDLLIVRDILYLLPDIFYFRVQSYTNLLYVESLAKSASFTNWYIAFAKQSVVWVAYALTMYVYVFGREFLKQRRQLLNLFCFALFMVGFANLSSLIPGGARFMTIANLFMYAFFILYFFHAPQTMLRQLIAMAMLPLLFIFVVVNVRVGMGFTGLFLLIGNPILALFMKDEIPLIDYLK